MERFDRNIRFFGEAGQQILSESIVAVLGCGGLGQHVIQQLAFLGVQKIIVIDDEDLSETNLNRYVLARFDDPIPGTTKVDIVRRGVALINPDITVIPVHAELRSKAAFETLASADVIFGCLDNDGARLILNEFSLAYSKDLFDLASDTESKEILRYGGRVAYVGQDVGCLVCMDLLDLKSAAEDLASDENRQDRAKIYGIEVSDLAKTGPSVVSLNGIIASLAVTEYMLHVTGIRQAKHKLEYRGNLGIVSTQKHIGFDDCYYCKTIKNIGNKANLDRFIIQG